MVAGSNTLGRKDVVVSSALFAFSAASLFAVDLLASARFSEEDLAGWAATKALIFIGSGFCLVGADQAVLRAEVDYPEFRRGLVRQALVLSPVVVAAGLLATEPRTALLGASGAVFLSVLAGISGFHRSRFAITRAHLAFQAWKPALLIGTGVLVVVNSSRLPEAAVLLLGGWVGVFIFTPDGDRPEGAATFAELGPVGRRFWLAALVASGMQYVDQLLLNMAGETEASAEYFKYVVVFLAFATLFTALIAQVGNPWVRQNIGRLQQIAPRVSLFWVGASAIAAACSIVFGALLNQVLDVISSVRYSLVVVLAALAFVRLLYLLPSAIVGVVSSREQLSRLLMGTSASLVLFGASFLVLLRLDIEPVFAVAFAALGSSLARLLVATKVAAGVLRVEGELEMVL